MSFWWNMITLEATTIVDRQSVAAINAKIPSKVMKTQDKMDIESHGNLKQIGKLIGVSWASELSISRVPYVMSIYVVHNIFPLKH
jgi:hypothetical protein